MATATKTLWALLVCVLHFAGVVLAEGVPHSTKKDRLITKPKKIVSLNLCTDQLLMMLVPKERIAAVSYLAQRREASAMHREAQTLPIISGGAEDVILLKPDLVIAGTYTTRATVHLLRKLGVNLIEIAPSRSFDDIIKSILAIGAAAGEKERAEDMAARLRADLAALGQAMASNPPVMAPFYANGYSSGKQTLVDTVLSRAGYKSLGRKIDFSGTRKLNLETLIVEKPDALLLGHKSYPGDALAYETFRHPVLRSLKKKTPYLSIADALTICGTPHTVDAIRQLKKFSRDIQLQRKHHTNKSGQEAHKGSR